ncbi:DUF1737 domain-containing protein [Blastococcus deserti]|uniref:DUF1737 domain-containing protein n=1 Tax=Blastococcus deserti TaxID=2259033 RepID=A0ABW4XD71_9ACTN
MTTADEPLTYRLLPGPDDTTFCARVSQALAEGYRLHGSPALTFDGRRIIAVRAMILPRRQQPGGHEDHAPGRRPASR